MKRFSWTRQVQGKPSDTAADPVALGIVDDILYDLWELGRNIILVWTPQGQGIDLLVIPHYLIGDAITGNGAKQLGTDTVAATLQKLVAGPKMVSADCLRQTAELLNTRPQHIDLPVTPGKGFPPEAISSLVKRYSITLVEDRAVALFDIVGFTRYTPLEQVTQLNSLSYSVNVAYSKLMGQDIEIRFARANTGDGFYIWNRDRGINSNLDLYHFMHLVMAENAIARSRASQHTVPLLRTCFHVGRHYEFYQSEGLNPTTFSYIVGDVTIELARMIEKARPGQLLIGEFRIPMHDSETGETIAIDSVEFIHRTQPRLSSLENLELGGDRIDTIKCYLTGSRKADDQFAISRYLLVDKHGYTRHVYNAKVNIHREKQPPIYLGLQDSDLTDFGVQESPVTK